MDYSKIAAILLDMLGKKTIDPHCFNIFAEYLNVRARKEGILFKMDADVIPDEDRFTEESSEEEDEAFISSELLQDL